MSSHTRTIIIGILVLAGRSVTVPQLVRLAMPLGLSASNVKSHLTRLVQERALCRHGPRRLATYGPSPEQSRVVQGIHERLAATVSPAWDGTWLMLALQFPPSRSLKKHCQAALWFDGFRPITPHLFVRPAWPLPWAELQARHYCAVVSGSCFRGKLITPSNALENLYDLDGLDAEARRLAEWIRKRATTGASSAQAAFVEQITVGGRVARFIGHDPRLPPALWRRRLGLRDVVAEFKAFETRINPKTRVFIRETIKH